MVGLGSSRYMTAVDGKTVSYTDYNEWGTQTQKSVLNLGARALDLTMNYTNHPYDPIIDKYYAQNRVYDATNRRFSQTDPIKEGMNWYSYVNNNPTRWVDWLGLSKVTVNGVNIDNTYNVNDKNYVSVRDMIEKFEGPFINGKPSVEWDEVNQISTFRIADRLTGDIMEIAFSIDNVESDIVTPRKVTINGKPEYINFVFHDNRNMISVRDFSRLIGLEGYLQWYNNENNDQFVVLRKDRPYAYDNFLSVVDTIVSKQGGYIPTEIDEANVKFVNRMTGDQIIDFLNKKLGLDGTASIDKNGNVVIRDLTSPPGITLAAAAGADPNSVAALFGGAYATSGNIITGSKSLTAPIVDVSAFNPFSIVVDRTSDPIYIDLSTASPPSVIRDLTNARQDEIAAEINRQIADAIQSAPPGANLLWVKCTVEDGRFCLTSESFGFLSYVEVAGGQEIYDLFGVIPSQKQGNIEQQGKLVGSRDFREPVVDITQFRDALTGDAPTIRIVVNGVFIANICLDDGDPTIDPHNMTLRQMMKKIDDQLGMHGSLRYQRRWQIDHQDDRMRPEQLARACEHRRGVLRIPVWRRPDCQEWG